MVTSPSKQEKEKDNSWHFGGKLIQKKNIQE
jgi:hypothetical protein